MAEAQPPRGERTRMSPEMFTEQWAQIRQHLRGWWDQLTEQDLVECPRMSSTDSDELLIQAR